MMIHFTLEIKSKLAEGQSYELYKKIEKYGAKVIDLGTQVYVLGELPFQQLAPVLYECLPLGIVECEIGIKE